MDFPPDLRSQTLQRGRHMFRQRGSLSAIVWQDKRQVNVLSTLTTPNETASIQRKEKDGTQTTLDCPTAITTYNRYMAGVDKGDQLHQYYRLRMKFMKNYKYIFLLDVAITNSYILYSKFSPADKKQKLKDFRLSLAQELIGDYCGRMRIGRPRLLTTPSACRKGSVHTAVAIGTRPVDVRVGGTVAIARVIQHCVSRELLIMTTAGGSGTLLTKTGHISSQHHYYRIYCSLVCTSASKMCNTHLTTISINFVTY